MWDPLQNQRKSYPQSETEPSFGSVVPSSFFRLQALFLFGTVLTFCVILSRVVPLDTESEHWFTICWWKHLTGWDCPGCGLGRAVVCFFRGDFSGSWNYHPFGIPIAILGLIGVYVRSGSNGQEWNRLLNSKAITVTIWAFALGIFYWYIRKHFF